MKRILLCFTKAWLTRQAGILGLFLLSLYLVGCNNQKSQQQYVIGFSQCVGSDMWRKTMLDEMKMELSLHQEVKFIYTDAGGSSKKQIGQVQEMIDQNIDLLIISPNEAQPLTSVVEQAFGRGIPVIVIDRKTSSSLYTAYVGADNFEIGKMAGEYFGITLKNGGSVVEVMGLSGSSPAIDRQRGFYAGLKKFNDVELKAQLYGNWLKDVAEAEMYKDTRRLSEIDAIFAHNDQMALGAREVLNKLNLGNKVKIVGVDALPGEGGGLEMVLNNTIDASLVYPTGGKEAIKTAFSILNKDPFEKENILPTVVIDSSNVKLMKMQWNKVSSQQKDIELQQSLILEQQKIYNDQRLILNIIVISLVLAVLFGGLAFYSLNENRKINRSLEQKNGEIQDQRNQLIEMSAGAAVATEAKLNFFTNISHEFRTPLTLIIAPLEDLLENEKLHPLAGKNLKLIHKNVLRLLLLVNQLIDYRKIEYDKMRIKASYNDLLPFVREIVEAFQDTASRRNIHLKLLCEEKDLMVWFDINMLDKVIFNVLSNAFKFTNVNGRINITLGKSVDKGQVFIKIEDNGIGMTEESVQHAFELFYQADQSTAKGSGLGLSLSKELIHLHHGTIDVNSKKWEGTIFTITLPLDADNLDEDEKVSMQPPREIFSDDVRVFTTPLEECPKVEDWSDFNIIKENSILIVEDNEDLLQYLAQKFSEHYEVFTANNGTAGLSEAYDRVPDLIISDVVLPEISGKELTSRLKTDVRTSHIPIILLTAQSRVEQQIEGMKNMADAYLVKPFNFAYLMENVNNLIKNRLLLKEHYVSEFPLNNKIPISKKLDKKFLNDFAGIVENNIANDKFNVDHICKNIGISRVQLYRKVKALLGCNISDYILNRRLQKAKYLLLNTNLTISEITYQVGFSSPTYFSTVFKAHFELSPSEFKKAKMKAV
jgi:signal transduction histidine kinase/AraC-like DNA-binding protein/ABC-type xylose transport system substrate-binding protein